MVTRYRTGVVAILKNQDPAAMTQQQSMDKMVSRYRDHRSDLNDEAYQDKLFASSTLYIGNLAFYTTEGQIYELFSMAGEVKRVIMGLDRIKRTPCGFCFVEYYTHEDALNAINYIGGTKLDNRIIRTDWDPGFVEGRQYGRGRGGGQVRDDYRQDYDEGRGGLGGKAQKLREEKRQSLSSSLPTLASAAQGSDGVDGAEDMQT